MKSSTTPFPGSPGRSGGTLAILLFLAGLNAGWPSFLFREDWAETPFALPITQEHVVNPDLTLHLYGVAVTGLKKSHHDTIPDDPYYVWSGEIDSPWVASLSHAGGVINASGHACVRWLTRQSGDNVLSIAVKLEDGDWLITGPLVPATPDWIETTHFFDQVDWFELLVGETIERGQAIANPDLSAITEIGFTDLMPGNSSDSSSRVDWLEFHVADDQHLCGISTLDLSPGSCPEDVGFLLDGNLGTRWFAEGDEEWLSVELNRAMRLEGIDIAWYRGAERLSFFEIESSEDGQTWTPLYSNGTSSGLTADGEHFLLQPVTARYVRVVGWGNEVNVFNSITEVRLRGRELNPVWWEGAPVRQLNGEWRESDWMGWFSTRDAPWVYHTEFGWFITGAESESSVWVWDPRQDWLWTSRATYPFFYRNSDQAWLWFQYGPSPRWFFNYLTAQWEEEV